MSNVLQPWVGTMPWKCQSILLSGLRGPDDCGPPAVKDVNRWLRTVCQHNADPSKAYMRREALPSAAALCDELEWMTCHYVHHFADALRTVAIWHHDNIVCLLARNYHAAIAEELFHFIPEGDGTFVDRHRDVVAHD